MWLQGLFLVKLIAGITLAVIYSQFYGNNKLTGDTLHYYNDGRELNKVFFESPSDYFELLFFEGEPEMVQARMPDSQHWTRSDLDQFNDNRFIIRVNSIISFFSFNSYFAHVIVFAFLSLIGFVLFYKSLEDFIPKFHLQIMMLIVLFPSMLFWTSSILKESLLVFGFGLLIYGFRFFIGNPYRKSMLILMGLFILINTKVYFLICLLPALLVYLIVTESWKQNFFRLTALGLISLLLLILNSYASQLNVVDTLSKKQNDFNLVGKGGVYFMDDENFYRIPYKNISEVKELNSSILLLQNVNAEVKRFGSEEYLKDTILIKGSKFEFHSKQVPSNSYFELPAIKGEWLNLIKHGPVYIANVLLMPYPWQKASVLKWFCILENLILYGLLFLAVWFRKSKEFIDYKLLLFSLSFLLLFYLIIGATTPVIGALVRYKSPAFLIWILLFLSIIDLERITLKSKKNN